MAETTTIRRTTTTSPVAQRRLARLRRYRTRTTTTRTIRRGLPIIVPVVLGLGVAAYLLWAGEGRTEEPDKRPTNGGGGRPPVPGPPIGPRPPNTWGNLPRARVTADDGVLARTGPGNTFPIGPGGGNKGSDVRDPNHNMAPWAGTTVAVLETGLTGPGADEWWKIITPGGYELYSAAVVGGKRLLTHDPASAPLPARGGGGERPVQQTVSGAEAGQWFLPAAYPYAAPQPVYPYRAAYPHPYAPWGSWGYPAQLEIVGRRR